MQVRVTHDSSSDADSIAGVAGCFEASECTGVSQPKRCLLHGNQGRRICEPLRHVLDFNARDCSELSFVQQSFRQDVNRRVTETPDRRAILTPVL